MDECLSQKLEQRPPNLVSIGKHSRVLLIRFVYHLFRQTPPSIQPTIFPPSSRPTVESVDNNARH
jgi:hypothetical protein